MFFILRLTFDSVSSPLVVLVTRSDLDVVDECDVFSLDFFLGPDERRVGLGLLLLALLHSAHRLSAV